MNQPSPVNITLEALVGLHLLIRWPGAALPRCPARPQHIGRLAIDAVRGVHNQLVPAPLVHPCRADMLVELCYLRRDVTANEQVLGDVVPRLVSGAKDRIHLAEGEDAVRGEGGGGGPPDEAPLRRPAWNGRPRGTARL